MSEASVAHTKSTGKHTSRQKRRLVHALNPHDVILGRGQHVKNEGNRHFVALVRAHMVEYNTSPRGKDVVARQILQAIEALGGRFVRSDRSRDSVERTSEAAAAAPVWEIVDPAPVLVKIKQTFRDYAALQRRVAGEANSGGAATVHPPGLDSNVINAHATTTLPHGMLVPGPFFQMDGSVFGGDNQIFGSATELLHSATLDPASVAPPMVLHPARTATTTATVPIPAFRAELIPNDMLRQVLHILLQNEPQRHWQERHGRNEPMRTHTQPAQPPQPLSFFNHSVQGPPVGGPGAILAVERLTERPAPTDTLRRAVDVWLQNESPHQQSRWQPPTRSRWQPPTPIQPMEPLLLIPGRPLSPPPSLLSSRSVPSRRTVHVLAPPPSHLLLRAPRNQWTEHCTRTTRAVPVRAPGGSGTSGSVEPPNGATR